MYKDSIIQLIEEMFNADDYNLSKLIGGGLLLKTLVEDEITAGCLFICLIGYYFHKSLFISEDDAKKIYDKAMKILTEKDSDIEKTFLAFLSQRIIKAASGLVEALD